MRFAAALVHLFTALGAVCALFAMLAIFEQDWRMLFFWLGAAFFVDGIDGTFARMVNVQENLPRFSGERLDIVIDYVTYVFVPALALMAGGYLSGTWGVLFAALILLSSLYHFADTDSKADDLSFVGFPAIWNIVAFYIFAFQVSQATAMWIVAICVALTFIPMKWVHPLRVAHWMPATIVATLAWSVAGMVVVQTGFEASPAWARAVLFAVLIYGAFLALLSMRDQAEADEDLT